MLMLRKHSTGLIWLASLLTFWPLTCCTAARPPCLIRHP